MGSLRVEVLGRVGVRHAGAAVPLGAKATALVCYLALDPRPHPRATLAGLLWGDLPEQRARANLRMVVAELRQALGDHVEITPTDIAPEPGWQLDVTEVGDGLTRTDPRHLEAALAALHDGTIAGLQVDGAPDFDDWLMTERSRLRQRLVGDVTTSLRRLSATAPERAIPFAHELARQDPLDEGVHRLLMELLTLTGRRAAALAQYDRCRRELAEALGVDPSPETVALRDRLLGGDPDVRRGGTPDAPPAGRGTRATRRLTVPAPPAGSDPLVGRDDLLQRVVELVTTERRRVVTLVGPGGAGKTRLALAAAERLAPAYEGGAAFIPLASVPANAHEAVVAAALADALGVPPWRDSPIDAVRRALAGRSVLVVLDNAEHLLLAELVRTLVESAPGVTVVSTSRRRLGLAQEWLVEVGGLACPLQVGPELATAPAPALFAARARRVRPDFAVADDPEAVIRICRLVDGLPLALVLAAEWTRTLDVSAVADLVAGDSAALATDDADLEARHRSLRSVLDASWRLLGDDLRVRLRRLSVFRGGFDATAAAAVADTSHTHLAVLVDRCLVERAEGSRFDLHELVRQDAERRLDADPGEADTTRDRHAAHFATLARRIRAEDLGHGPDVHGADGNRPHELEADLDNVRAAARWLAAHGDEDRLADCLGGLWRVDQRRGRFVDALALLETALARDRITPARAAEWHTMAGAAAYQLGRMDRALAEVEAGFAAVGRPLPHGRLAVAAAIAQAATVQALHRLVPVTRRRHDHRRETVAALSLLANATYFLQQPTPSLLYTILEANAADSADEAEAASCAYAELAVALAMRRRRRLAAWFGKRADARATVATDSDLLATALQSRAVAHLGEAAWNQADATVSRGLALGSAQVGHRLAEWYGLAGVAAQMQARHGAAQRAFATALAAAEEAGDELAVVWCRNGLSDAELGLGGDLEEVRAGQAAALDLSRRLTAQERLSCAATMGAMQLAEGHTREAAGAARLALEALPDVRFRPVWSLDAYGHLAQVWLGVWQREDEPEPEVTRAATWACRELHRLARTYPVARSRSAWARGWMAWLSGHPRRARVVWRQGVDAARRLRMPYDEARIHAALADTAETTEVAAECLTRAHELVGGLGLRPHLLHLVPTPRTADPGR